MLGLNSIKTSKAFSKLIWHFARYICHTIFQSMQTYSLLEKYNVCWVFVRSIAAIVMHVKRTEDSGFELIEPFEIIKTNGLISRHHADARDLHVDAVD